MGTDNNSSFGRYNTSVNDLTVHLVDDRRAQVSPYSRGNSKLGPDVYTYSKLPGRQLGSCPGSSPECELFCYAKRVINNPWIWELWKQNTQRDAEIPELPDDADLVRWHVSGDFDSVRYVINWIDVARHHPDVTFYGYTRSWRVPELLPSLKSLADQQNVVLFASVDRSIDDIENALEFRIAWNEGDHRIPETAIICPEERGVRNNCRECGFCFTAATTKDIVFLESSPDKNAWNPSEAKGLTMPRT